MGQPTHNSAQQQQGDKNNGQSSATTSTTSPPSAPSAPRSEPPPTSQPGSNPTALPPAALDLAAKLFDLARAGDTATISQYLSAGIPPNLTNHAGDTLLMLAAYHGHVETVKILLDKGADPNVLNDRGQSPLAGVLFKGFDEVAKVLWEKGGDVRAGQPSALDCAYMFKRREMLRLWGEPIPDEPEGRPAETQEWA